jgi:hypothetical protein
MEMGEEMTQPLRQLHVAMWLVLGCALATLLAAALTNRPDPTPANKDFRWGDLR